MQELVHTSEGELKFLDPLAPFFMIGTKARIRDTADLDTVGMSLSFRGRIGDVTEETVRYTTADKKYTQGLPRGQHVYLMVDDQYWAFHSDMLEIL